MTDTLTDPDLNLEELLADHLTERDGKLGARRGHDPRIPLLRDHIVPLTSLKVPRAVHRSLHGYDYGMLGNDTVGDCVIAAIYHAIMHARKTSARDDVPADSPALVKCVLRTYSKITGYDPADPSTDQGTDPTVAWAYWQRTGLPLPNGSVDKIAGSVQIQPQDGVNLRRAIYEFDSAGLSLALPVAWQGAKVWDVGGNPSDPDWQPGGWGGHEVLGVSFDARNIAVVTWGGVKLLTWRAWGVYGELALTQVSQDEIGKTGVSETGVSLQTLEQDIPNLY